jgi:Ca-activated chloride channel family protein
MRTLFSNPWFLALLGLLPALAWLGVWAGRRRARALALLGNAATLGPLLAIRRPLRRLRGIFWVLALLLLVAGAAGPRWGKDWDRGVTGRDLIVVLDCSRSMLAENPSRLTRARAALAEMSEELQRRGGHRLGLVVFAGRAKLLCPLSHDYDLFREALADIKKPNVERKQDSEFAKKSEMMAADPDIRPGPREASGTRIGAGLREALRHRDPRFPGGCDVLLVSDGDDPANDGEWAEGAADMRLAGVAVYTVGVGNPNPSAAERKVRVDGVVQRKPDGSDVETVLTEDLLRDIARQTSGSYTPMRTNDRPQLGRLYLDLVADKPTREDADDAVPVLRPRYEWFLLPAFVFLCAAVAIPDRVLRFPQR